MKAHGCKNMVFSSSCTVYGEPTYVPLDEIHPLKAINPYGRTKLIIEDIFRDTAISDPEWWVLLLLWGVAGVHGGGEGG